MTSMKKTCKKCLLPTDYLNIEIDDKGICQHCRNFSKTEFLGPEKLLELVQEPLKRNQSKKYDCVVGYSGGRDSTYLLWYVVKKLKLRPLAVFSDDLFIPEIVYENMENTCRILDVDLRTIKHDNLKKCLPHHLKAWIRRPVPESLAVINVGERIGYETLVEETAVKEGVHLIFGGRTPIQEEERYKSELIKLSKSPGRQGKMDWIMGYGKQVLLNPALVSNLFCLKLQYKEFTVNKWKQKLIEENDLTIVYPFYDYVHWVEDELEEILFNELNWKLPEGKINSSRFGCEADTLRQYLFYRTLGYNDTHVDLSYLIRDGQISKEEAKDKLEDSLDFGEGYIEYILNKAGVNGKQFIQVLDRKYPETA
ncbi:hypothetical protein EI546_05895 [Aequorivita sp. H23M31]|uniref:N-acetyl sugar amidotransferase n=1 Tax=Aequorivita ciconiae TaxID=2494375 RepID=A0A410G1X8_9FLAO|nr:hypothetical protein [Aequorivita sp. H23M31]QAA81287.1 hypothetical protein EI546_05895 [Aequorivita sp. H23M31]